MTRKPLPKRDTSLSAAGIAIRFRAPPCRTTLLLAAPTLLGGCAMQGAPAFSVVGAYFPSWMLCAMIGIATAVLLRAVFVPSGIDAILSFRLFTYVALGVMAALAAWLIWFGP